MKSTFKNNWYLFASAFVIFAGSSLIRLDRATASIWEELTGDAARNRTADSRAQRDRLIQEAQAVERQVAARRAEIAAATARLDEGKARILANRQAIVASLNDQMARATALRSAQAQASDDLNARIAEAGKTSSMIQATVANAQDLGEGAQASATLGRLLARETIPAETWAHAAAAVRDRLPPERRPSIDEILQRIQEGAGPQGALIDAQTLGRLDNFSREFEATVRLDELKALNGATQSITANLQAQKANLTAQGVLMQSALISYGELIAKLR